MAKKERSFTVGEIAQALGGEVSGDPNLVIVKPVPANSEEIGGITFAENEKYLATALKGGAVAIIVPPETEIKGKTIIRVPAPRMAFGFVLAMFSTPMPARGIDPTARVSELAEVHASASIGPYAVVEDYAVIGAQANIMAYAYIGESCKVGNYSEIFPHVTLVQNVVVGNHCRIHSGSVIGADGFGYFWNGNSQQKVPQVGGVIIGNSVEIGANTCIDRATCGNTVIKDGVKIDNLVQIAHNSTIGSHTVMASQVGISGSTIIGEGNVFGGQAATSDHVTIGNNMVFGGRSGIIGDMDTPGEYFGTPAIPLSTAMRVIALQNRLPDLFKRMRALERELEALKND